MGASLALAICGVGIAGLFFLDRDKSTRTSKALWLPVIWLWMAGSRSIPEWLGTATGSAGIMAQTVEGNPLDAAIFEALIFAGIIVFYQRRRKTIDLLKANSPLLIYFLYCLISIAWSPIPGPAFKRWTKAVGDLIMMFIVVTDAHPTAALRKLYSRVGFILLPLSVALIRYTTLGREFGGPGGDPTNTGVTTNKNSLGLIVFVISLGALWNVRGLLLDKKAPNRTRRLIAQFTLLAFGIILLQEAHSATSIFCFVLGAVLMLAMNLRSVRNRPVWVHVLCVGVLLVGASTVLFGAQSIVTSALGRESNFSGRIGIWKASLDAADSPIFGTGFESFWNVNVEKVALGLTEYWDIHHLVTAHNGYIEVYLDLGLVGLCLIAFLIVSGYRRATAAFRRNPDLGSLVLAYIITIVFYNITEAGFRTLTPSWIFLLLAVVTANGIVAGLIGRNKPKIYASRRRTSDCGWDANDKLVGEGNSKMPYAVGVD
jgi:exopolysaccharide production protein ExoQ